MIARLTVAVPFAIAVPEGSSFALWSVEEDGCQIVSRPPVKTDLPLHVDVPDDIQLDGGRAFVANALQIDFRKPAFNRRRDGEQDPPMALLQRAVTSFLARLRYTTRAAQIHPIDLHSGATWRLQYLNDDESELLADPALHRGLRSRAVSISFVSLTPAVWDAAHKLDSEWASPVWDDILLDATQALPAIGTAVVLAATALEVFISHILDKLAAGGQMPEGVWNWLNNRDSWLKNPSTEEQFDVLLKHFTGHSLKEQSKLWQGFRELRTARNRFVHEGAATIGSQFVSREKAEQLVGVARDIIATVREWLPSEQRWPLLEPRVQVTFQLPVT